LNAIVMPTASQRLAALADQARAEMSMLSFATKPWVLPKTVDGQPVRDVVIIGAGQNGLVAAHALKRRGVIDVLLLDRNPKGHEGVWDTYARNYEIRSPKDITGADLGFPSLSIESFFKAMHGAAAWERIERVPRTDWMDYLRWYRDIADLEIENEIGVTDIDFGPDAVRLSTTDGRTILARQVVLATGMEGGGGWNVAPFIAHALPRERYNHSCDLYDPARFAGLAIGVLGAGASAFDATVTALDAGAKSVDMFMRRPQLPMIDAAREVETAGQLFHGCELSDLTKWELSRFMVGLSQSPAEHHFFRALDFPHYRAHVGAPWTSVAMEDDKVRVETPRGVFHFDHVISATGVTVDMASRPELARLAGKALLWRHRFTPPEADPPQAKLNFPYLDREYRFQEREPGTAPGIERVYAFNALATLSMGGMSAVSISCHKYGVPRLVNGITGRLFLEQEDRIIDHFRNYRTPGIVVPEHAKAMFGLAEPQAQVAAE
jgi:cation diffusion facilitator CzcD-associated flavoprotein CzcO